MENLEKDKTKAKTRHTIGYLDENAYAEYPGKITRGIFEAAKKHDLNIIRFGHYDKSSIVRDHAKIDFILQHMQQYNLDALLFLGWARAAAYENHEHFRRMFSSIPLFSVGRGFPDIPHTYFPGDVYLGKMLQHLIQVHGFTKIAFIEPFSPDFRIEVYKNMMKEYGFYDERLYISEAEVANLEIPHRGIKAVSILLDDRKVEVQAIVSLYNNETKWVIQELQRRGLKVPGDIAVTSYEDGEIGKFSSPAFTTIYFPYYELGYASCEKMADILRKKQVPLANLVPGRIEFRESCGCVKDPIRQSIAGRVETSDHPFEGVTELEMGALAEELHRQLECRLLDAISLLKAFRDNFLDRDSRIFLTTLDTELKKILVEYAFTDVENLVSILRKLLLPYFMPYLASDKRIYLWAEDIFQQAQVLLLDKKTASWALEEIRSKSANTILQKISTRLVDNFSVENLMESLETYLPSLNIPSCYIFIFKNLEEKEKLFDHCVLAFEYRDYKRVRNKKHSPFKAGQKLAEILFPEDRPYMMMANLLNVGDDFFGFVLFESGPPDERIYKTLAIHISSALSGAILLQRLDSSYNRLIEQAHKKGMADIASGILHNVGNILNSINVSIHLIKDLAVTSPAADLLRANNLMEKNMEDIENFILHHAKGKKLMQFYSKLGGSIENFQEQLLNQVNRLIDNINLIEDIITAQESYEGVKLTLEEADLVLVVEDALKMNIASLEKGNIKIIRNYGKALSKTMVQKTKLFHVLVNLINNAKDAMAETPEEQRLLTVSISQGSQGKIIRVTDTGQGIKPDMLESIFGYGYTTKKSGHGFGLHSCANYMTEMGGKIWAESEGPGKGANFVVQLPN